MALVLSGCGTMNPMQNSCMSEGFNHVYTDYTIDVTSEPPGAKVDWNGQYVGVTPLKRVLNGRRGMAAPTVVTVHAVSQGQRCETRAFPGNEPLPREMHFDLTK
jgi:hypothetical protein